MKSGLVAGFVYVCGEGSIVRNDRCIRRTRLGRVLQASGPSPPTTKRMARFRAYASESSSSDEESDHQPTTHKPPPKHYEEEEESEEEEDEEEEEDYEESSPEGSMSSEGLLEDELVHGKSRTRPRTALVEDENGDIQLTGDEDLDLQESASSSSSRSSTTPEPRGYAGDPNLIPRARQLGVDAQRMHVMQTSLFRVPEEAAALKALKQPSRRQNALNPDASVTLNRKHSRDSDGDGLRHDSREVRTVVFHARVLADLSLIVAGLFCT